LVSEKPCAAAPAITVHYGADKRRILLQAGDTTLTYSRLLYEIRALFSLWSKPKLLLSLEPPPASSFLSSTSPLVELANKTLYVIT
uniref:PB1 domain-containing protein n=1 Tax=Gongylonema pulchrum TaxID=637853 RepID=A0A183EB10_9BILA